MNKLKVTITGLLVACLGMGVVGAQTPTATPVAKQAPAKKTATKAKPAAGTSKDASATPAKPAQHLKKDGTPDMRYKENKAAAGKTTTKAAPKKTNAATGTTSGK